jgi:hypothetical protein
MNNLSMTLDGSKHYLKFLAPKLCLGAHGREALLPVSYSRLMAGTEHGKQSLQDVGSPAELGTQALQAPWNQGL